MWKDFGIRCPRMWGWVVSRRAPPGLGLCPRARGAGLTVLLAGVVAYSWLAG